MSKELAGLRSCGTVFGTNAWLKKTQSLKEHIFNSLKNEIFNCNFVFKSRIDWHVITPKPAVRQKKMFTIDLCYDEQLSPSKVLRAATLRNRFADTILKARQNALLNNGATVDAVKMQQERERLQKKEQEVKAKMEEKIRAAKAAARDKAEAKLKMQREREREEARMAVQNVKFLLFLHLYTFILLAQMEKTVDIEDNKEVLKDLEMLVYNQSSNDQVMAAMAIDGCHGNLLEQLGLFMKNDDDMEDDTDSVSGSS
ncbi:hypothetical protein ACLOJK_040617 [Asimina triloba]